jgi:hypothetical protein
VAVSFIGVTNGVPEENHYPIAANRISKYVILVVVTGAHYEEATFPGEDQRNSKIRLLPAQ